MRHWLLFFIAILSLSQAANLVRLSQAPPDVIGTWRLLGASLIMFFIAYSNKSLHSLFKNASKNLPVTIASGVFLYAHLWTYFFAAQNTKIANAVIIFAVNPIFTALGAYLFLKEKFTFKIALAYVFAFFGMFQLFKSSLQFNPSQIQGEVSALASAFLYSGYLLTGSKARQNLSNSSYTSLIYLIAGLCFLASALYKNIPLYPQSAITCWSIIGLIAFPTLLGHAIFTYLLKHLNINLMSCGKLLEPSLSALIAFLLFTESLSLNTMTAFIFTASAVLTLFFPFTKKSN